MAIEDDDLRDREIWTAVSRHWYSKASDDAPTTGRLHHHLAILARPHAVAQLFHYTKALCVPIPFGSARDSIHTLFDPLWAPSQQKGGSQSNDAAFVRVHSALYSSRHANKREAAMEDFLGSLDLTISRLTKSWMETGYQMAVAMANAVLGYGAEDHVMMLVINPPKVEVDSSDVAMTGVPVAHTPSPDLDGSVSLMVQTSEIVFRRFGDPNIYPFLHVSLVFLNFLSRYPAAMYHLEAAYPWKLLALMLNTLSVSYSDFSRVEGEGFPRGESSRPLPEDYALRGLLWTEEQFFPDDWFSSAKVDDDERYLEVASMTDERKQRILWLACQISKSGRCLTYSKTQFGVTKDHDIEIAPAPPAQAWEMLTIEVPSPSASSTIG